MPGIAIVDSDGKLAVEKVAVEPHKLNMADSCSCGLAAEFVAVAPAGCPPEYVVDGVVPLESLAWMASKSGE